MERDVDLAPFLARAGEAASFLAALANSRRLLALCNIAEFGEMPVSRLAEAVGLSQSAMSQHLAKLRTDGLVDTRKDAQTIYYRLSDPRLLPLLLLLRDQFSPELRRERG